MVSYKLFNDDCLKVLKTFEDNSIDSVVTDPPYGISFMQKRWDTNVPSTEFWKEVLRVLKPGGHLLSFFSTRTYHRGVVNIEDAGFEIRDQLAYAYVSGFPKSQNISLAINKKLGLQQNRGKAFRTAGAGDRVDIQDANGVSNMGYKDYKSDEAKEWSGYGTALKPAFEPIVMARKPLSEKTIAENVIRYTTGGLNIDGCRVGDEPSPSVQKRLGSPPKESIGSTGWKTPERLNYNVAKDGELLGRWPANIVADGDSLGNYSKFFFCTKASKKDRNEGLEGMEEKNNMRVNAPRMSEEQKTSTKMANIHPTVKGTDLMQWLVRLVTPRGGVVLDPYMGSGSTGKACIREGFNFIGIEIDEEYYQIAEKRICHEKTKQNK
jgi:site-specific DNA-methyltransferase (adenine-specific)